MKQLQGVVWVVLSFCVFAAPSPAAAFWSSGKVASALTGAGTRYVCALTSPTRFKCRWKAPAGNWTQCSLPTAADPDPDVSIPFGIQMPATGGGLYLVSGAPGQDAPMFFSGFNPTTQRYEIGKVNLDHGDTDCVSLTNQVNEGTRYITGNWPGPHIGSRLSVALDSADNAWFFTVVPSSDLFAHGALIAGHIDMHGAGGFFDWGYQPGQFGIAPAQRYADNRVAAVTSSCFGQPIVGLVDRDNPKKPAMVFQSAQAGAFTPLLGSQNADLLGDNSVAITNPPPQVVAGVTFTDSAFYVDDGGSLVETTLKCVGVGCCPGVGAMSLKDVNWGQINGAIPANNTQDSVAVATYTDMGQIWTRAYVYDGGGDAWSINTDNPGFMQGPWTNLTVDGARGWPIGQVFLGQQALIVGAAVPEFYGLCGPAGNPTLCSFTAPGPLPQMPDTWWTFLP